MISLTERFRQVANRCLHRFPSDSEKWAAAIKDEYDSLSNNGSWTLEEMPAEHKAIECKWAFKIKRRIPMDPFNDTKPDWWLDIYATPWSFHAWVSVLVLPVNMIPMQWSFWCRGEFRDTCGILWLPTWFRPVVIVA